MQAIQEIIGGNFNRVKYKSGYNEEEIFKFFEDTFGKNFAPSEKHKHTIRGILWISKIFEISLIRWKFQGHTFGTSSTTPVSMLFIF